MGITRVTTTREIEHTDVERVSCDRCGTEGDMFPYNPEHREWPAGFHRWTLQGGYGDNFPGDMVTFEIVVCEGCLQQWVSTFVNQNITLED